MSSSAICRGSDDDGFAAVDALTALTILTTAIALTLACAHAALHAADLARESRLANQMLVELAQSTPWRPGSSGGSSGAFTYVVETWPRHIATAGTLFDLCERTVSVRRPRTARSWRLATESVCRIDVAPPRTPATRS